RVVILAAAVAACVDNEDVSSTRLNVEVLPKRRLLPGCGPRDGGIAVPAPRCAPLIERDAFEKRIWRGRRGQAGRGTLADPVLRRRQDRVVQRTSCQPDAVVCVGGRVERTDLSPRSVRPP